MRFASRFWPAASVAHGAVMLQMAAISLAAIAVTRPPRGTGLTGNVSRAVARTGSDGAGMVGNGLPMFAVGRGALGSGSVVGGNGRASGVGEGSASEGSGKDGSGVTDASGGASVGRVDASCGIAAVAVTAGTGAGALGVSDLAGAHSATAIRTTHHRVATRKRYEEAPPKQALRLPVRSVSELVDDRPNPLRRDAGRGQRIGGDPMSAGGCDPEQEVLGSDERGGALRGERGSAVDRIREIRRSDELRGLGAFA